MNVTKTKPLEGFSGDMTRGEVQFENGESRWLILEDVAWSLHCILGGTTTKVHAGCLFTDVEDGIVINGGPGGVKVSYGEAKEFVQEWRPDVDTEGYVR